MRTKITAKQVGCWILPILKRQAVSIGYGVLLKGLVDGCHLRCFDFDALEQNSGGIRQLPGGASNIPPVVVTHNGIIVDGFTKLRLNILTPLIDQRGNLIRHRDNAVGIPCLSAQLACAGVIAGCFVYPYYRAVRVGLHRLDIAVIHRTGFRIAQAQGIH